MNRCSFRSKKAIVAICSLVYFVSYFSRKDFAAVMAGMISDNVINKSDGGLIGMGLFVCYGIGQLISGFLGDKIKPQIMILTGLSVTMLCNLAMPYSVGSTLLMTVLWSINGLAQAMLWPPIVRILSDNLDNESFVRANMIVTSAAHVSTVLLYLYVPLCLSFLDWHTVFFTATVMCALSVVVFIIAMRVVLSSNSQMNEIVRTPTPVSQKSTKSDGYFALVLHSGLIPILLSIVAMGFLRDGIESWLPTLYGEAFERDASESVLFSAILPVFSIISITVITALHKTRLFANEVQGTLVLFIASALISVPLSFLIETETTALRIICLVLCALVTACMHAANFLLISCLPGRFAYIGRAATTSGFCNACTYVGAAVSMYGIGAVADNLGWSVTVISWIAVAVCGAIFSVIAFRAYTRFINQSTK